ncbi:MAG: class I SAM-dependent methyltransferase, partial [Desulfobacterales bacterium]|nr:class I SAM-dependent methyltransferase [Desulfobacterales bacterium]
MSEWEKKREIMLHYDQTATGYDTQYSEEQKAKIEAALDLLRLTDNSLVLDMGCGTGLLFPYIAEKIELLVGIDLSLNLLKQAKKRMKNYSNTHIILADADLTPFQNQIFHTAFAITLMQNMPNPPATVKEIERITKPKSTIVLTTLKKKFAPEAILKLI